MSYFTGDWTKVPAFIDLNSEIKSWIEKYKIYKFIQSSNGFDVNGRVAHFDANTVWSYKSTLNGDEIETGFVEGDTPFVVHGWFLGHSPWFDHEYVPADLSIDCIFCWDNEEEYSPGCDTCEDGHLYISLQDLDALDSLGE